MLSEPRLRRLFGDQQNLLCVAIDHGVFGEWEIMRGAEDLQGVVDRVLTAGPSAIQLNAAGAERIASRGFWPTRLIVRADVTNIYLRTASSPAFSQLVDGFADRALRLDAAAVVVNLFERPGDGDLLRQCVRNVTEAKAACAERGMPLIVEPLVLSQKGDDTYGVDGRVERILPLVRQAVELGADIIKADPTDDVGAYRDVVNAAIGVPVLVRGGGKVDDSVLLDRTRSFLAAGARGVVYGRNVFQHHDPNDIVARLRQVLSAS